jgi:hypothetical protein
MKAGARVSNPGQRGTVRMNKREVAYRVALIVTPLLLFFLLLEAYLALFSPHKVTARPFFHIQSFFCEYHPVRGWANKPGYRDIVRVSDRSSFTVTHNSSGQRGREYPTARLKGVTRILALGDSFTWGFGVEDREVFTEVLASGPGGFEVVNLGVSGYGTDQELLLLI